MLLRAITLVTCPLTGRLPLSWNFFGLARESLAIQGSPLPESLGFAIISRNCEMVEDLLRLTLEIYLASRYSQKRYLAHIL